MFRTTESENAADCRVLLVPDCTYRCNDVLFWIWLPDDCVATLPEIVEFVSTLMGIIPVHENPDKVTLAWTPFAMRMLALVEPESVSGVLVKMDNVGSVVDTVVDVAICVAS